MHLCQLFIVQGSGCGPRNVGALRKGWAKILSNSVVTSRGLLDELCESLICVNSFAIEAVYVDRSRLVVATIFTVIPPGGAVDVDR